jgi:imidazolonepropionase-like amidohydrolase
MRRRKNYKSRVFVVGVLWICVGALTTLPARALPNGLDAMHDVDPFPSTYQPGPSHLTAITNASIFTGAGEEIKGGTVVMNNGKIVAVGSSVPVPTGATIIDGTGKWVTPGIIDPHSHLGDFPSPAVQGTVDVNEKTNPDTAEVWAENSVWPQDPGFDRARAAGVTTLQILPGSANLFGGRTVVLKNVPATTVQAMKFPGAPYGLKMACGENPKGDYGGHGHFPMTRMGEFAGYREAWVEAAEYLRKWEAYEQKVAKGEAAEPPKRDLRLDTLAGVLEGKIRPQIHCYRADEMANMIDVAKEFGYQIAAFHHAVEAYKIPNLFEKNDICAIVWGGGRWGFKMEAYDGIEENAAILQKDGVCVAIHSDSPDIIQHLNEKAAIALSAGRRAGIDIPEAVAVEWFTANPAKILGIDDKTGTLGSRLIKPTTR